MEGVMVSLVKRSVLVFFIFCTQLHANRIVPRGSLIMAEAGNCSIGPFGTTGNTGVYQKLCHRLSIEEKCVAYFKLHLKKDGKIKSAFDTAKTTLCLQKLSDGLID